MREFDEPPTHGPTREHLIRARGFFERALAIDARSVGALVGIASVDATMGAYILTDDRSARLADHFGNPVPDGTAAAKFFGANRVDAFYIAPVAVLKQGATLNADFARNRSGFTAGKLNARDAPDFITSDQNDEPTHLPAADALKAMVEREYPGFGIGVAP